MSVPACKERALYMPLRTTGGNPLIAQLAYLYKSIEIDFEVAHLLQIEKIREIALFRPTQIKSSNIRKCNNLRLLHKN